MVLDTTTMAASRSQRDGAGYLAPDPFMEFLSSLGDTHLFPNVAQPSGIGDIADQPGSRQQLFGIK